MNMRNPSRSETWRRLIRARLHPLRPLPTGLAPRLGPLPGIRAVLFDVYGTILAARQGEVGPHADTPARAAAAALRAAGFPPRRVGTGPRAAALLAAAIAAEHTRKRQAGIRHPEVDIRAIWTRVLNRLAREGRIRETRRIDAIERLCVEYECRANPAWPMPGLNRILQALARAGVRIGLVSNAQFYTPLILDALPGAGRRQGRFDPALAAWSYRLGEAKPSARLIRLSLRTLRLRYGIAPRQTVMVGNDLLNDLLPAARAGCRTALFAGDARSLRLRQDHPACARLRPDLVLTRLDQLSAALGIPPRHSRCR
jgi:putative hydrolase of the HAD superfamily